MSEELREKVISYMKAHFYLSLATVNTDNLKQPHAGSVVYVNNGLDLYFGTSAKTQKFINLTANPKVALTIDDFAADWAEIRGLQIEGAAQVVKEESTAFVYGIFAEKFPVIKNLPPMPDNRFIKITPRKLWMLDYGKGFGHRDYLEL
ncbi:MAG: pyridoxamine 5'-phosphate oxidase family protein [Deltaproteobacteria bacterium]|nr:pyridoxamine 5'-phosphate oxidase family protein [Deltaproteobacteria bacterium]